MSKLATQVTEKYDYKVRTTALKTEDGLSTDYIATINESNNKVLGVFTKRYGLTQNAPLVELVEDAFKTANMTNYKRKMSIARDGARLYATYDFRDKTQKIAVGDEIGLRLTLNNSFDGSTPVSFTLGAVRLVCSNGMVRISRYDFVFSRKHFGDFKFDNVQDAFNSAVSKYGANSEVFKKMAKIELTQDQGANILANLQKSIVISEKTRKGMQTIWENPTYKEDKARNLWNLYNATTQFLTHDTEGDRFELAYRTNERITNIFQGYVTKPETRERAIILLA